MVDIKQLRIGQFGHIFDPHGKRWIEVGGDEYRNGAFQPVPDVPVMTYRDASVDNRTHNVCDECVRRDDHGFRLAEPLSRSHTVGQCCGRAHGGAPVL